MEQDQDSRQYPRTAGSLSVVFLLAALLGSACGRPSKPVAHVGNAWVGQPQWQAYLKSEPAATLDSLARREVAWVQAERRGLFKGDEWQDFQRSSRRAILVRAYLAAQPGHGAFSEAQVREAFFSAGEERHVLHVLCSTREQAEAARQRIQKGEPFQKVAASLSKDPSAVQNHGDLGWIKRAQMVLPFAQAVFAVKAGDLCGPFQTEFGWHVARVAEIRSLGEEDFAKNKVRLMKEMQEAAATEKRPVVLQPLRAQYPLTIDKKVLDLDRTTVPVPGDEIRVAGRIPGASLSLKELKQFLGDYLSVSGASHGLGPETKARFLELMADDFRLAMAAEKAGMDKRPDIQAEIWDAQRRATFGAFSKTFLTTFEALDTDLKAHYDRYPDRFRSIGSVKLNLLVVDQQEVAELAMRAALNGTPWKALFDKYANKTATGNWDLGWVEVAKLQAILPKQAIQALLQNPLDRPIGPVPGPDGLMIFKVLERKPGPVVLLQDCRESVKQDFLKEHGAELVDKYLDTEGRKGIKVQEFPENAVVLKGS